MVEVDEPRLGGSDEVNDLHVGAELLVGGQVGVGGRGDHVVHEGKVLRNILNIKRATNN